LASNETKTLSAAIALHRRQAGTRLRSSLSPVNEKGTMWSIVLARAPQ
jgi:hypothetical protein